MIYAAISGLGKSIFSLSISVSDQKEEPPRQGSIARSVLWDARWTLRAPESKKKQEWPWRPLSMF